MKRFNHMIEVPAYEIAARLMLGPFGGIDHVRAQVLDACALGPGSRVLELGCGPGPLTEALVGRGGRVLAVDASAAMLGAARRRAPAATFVQADALTFAPTGPFDAIVLSFILHELPVSELPGLVHRLSQVLAPHGRLVLADHAEPPGTLGRAWRVVLRAVETRSIERWLEVDPPALLAGAGLRVLEDRLLAGGRAQLTVAVSSSS